MPDKSAAALDMSPEGRIPKAPNAGMHRGISSIGNISSFRQGQ